MVYILTVITLWNSGRVETEIEGVYYTYEGAKKEMDEIKEYYKQRADEKENLGQSMSFKYSFIISNTYTKE